MATSAKSLTEFLEHPHRDSHRLELFDGEIYQKPPLGPELERMVARLGASLDEFGFAGVEARILLEETPACGPCSPIPDIAFFKVRPQLRGDWPKSPPDLVVEVMPPKRNRLFQRGRVSAYLGARAGSVWVIDVERRCVEAHDKDARTILFGADRLTASSVPGLAIPVSTLFVELDRKELARAA